MIGFESRPRFRRGRLFDSAGMCRRPAQVLQTTIEIARRWTRPRGRRWVAGCRVPKKYPGRTTAPGHNSDSTLGFYRTYRRGGQGGASGAPYDQ